MEKLKPIIVLNDFCESGEFVQGFLDLCNQLDWTMYGTGSELYVICFVFSSNFVVFGIKLFLAKV